MKRVLYFVSDSSVGIATPGLFPGFNRFLAVKKTLVYTNTINSRHMLPPVANITRGKDRLCSAKEEIIRIESMFAKQKNLNILLLVTFARWTSGYTTPIYLSKLNPHNISNDNAIG
jgi:hypothetical protein